MECWSLTGKPHQLKCTLAKYWLKHGGKQLQFLCGQQHGTDADGARRYYKAYVQWKTWVTKAEVVSIFNLDDWDVKEAYGESEDFIGNTREGEFMIAVDMVRFGTDNQSLYYMATSTAQAMLYTP